MSIKIHDVCDSSSDIGREILSFLIPESKSVTFHKHSPNTFNDSYSSKYERAHVNNKLLHLFTFQMPTPEGRHL